MLKNAQNKFAVPLYAADMDVTGKLFGMRFVSGGSLGEEHLAPEYLHSLIPPTGDF